MRLKPLGGVHHVAHRRVVAARSERTDQHLARVDPDPHADRHVKLGSGGVQGLLHAQRGSHGPLCVVFVSHRRTEQGHDGVADDLVDAAAEGLDVDHHLLEAGVDQVLHPLGIVGLRQRSEAHQVGEEHRDDPPFVAAQPQVLPTFRAEACAVGNRGATGRAAHVGKRNGTRSVSGPGFAKAVRGNRR